MARLGSVVNAWIEVGIFTAAEMGRTAGKIEDLEWLLESLEIYRAVPLTVQSLDDCGEQQLGPSKKWSPAD